MFIKINQKNHLRQELLFVNSPVGSKHESVLTRQTDVYRLRMKVYNFFQNK